MVSFNAILDYKQSVFTFAPFGPSPPKVHVSLRYCFLSRRCSFRNGFSIEIILHRKLFLIPNPRACNRIWPSPPPPSALDPPIFRRLLQTTPSEAFLLFKQTPPADFDAGVQKCDRWGSMSIMRGGLFVSNTLREFWGIVASVEILVRCSLNGRLLHNCRKVLLKGKIWSDV